MQEETFTRDFILSGEIKHFEGFMEQWTSLHPKGWPSVHGPIYGKTSITWYIANGYNMILDWMKNENHPGNNMMCSGPGYSFDFRRGMDLSDAVSLADKQGVKLAEVFGVAEISVTAIPNNQIRVLFTEGNINAKKAFWKWVEDFVAELEKYGFKQLDLNTPLWATKQPEKQAMANYDHVIQAVSSWIPKQRYRSEEAYESGLAEFLVGKGISAPQQQGANLTDILASYGIGIEIKLNPSRSEYDRLSGQILRQLEEYGLVIVLIIRPEKRDLLDEYKARFDNRVTFVTIG